MYTTEIAHDGDARDVLSVKSKDTGRWSGEVCALFDIGHSLMLKIVCGGYLGQQTSNHFYNIANGHSADLVLYGLVTTRIAMMVIPICQKLFIGEALNVSEISNMNGSSPIFLDVSCGPWRSMQWTAG